MSDSRTTSGPANGSRGTLPRALIHKKILDVAESRPDASLKEIADDVSGATISIVEHVLEEYGDPGDPTDEPEVDAEPGAESALAEEDSTDPSTDELESAATGDERQSSSSADVSLEPEDVTEKQLETFREIHRHPDATQAELAETLGVSSATINQRVNAIDEFDWSNRREFVRSLFDSEPDGHADDGLSSGADQSDSTPDANTVRDDPPATNPGANEDELGDAGSRNDIMTRSNRTESSPSEPRSITDESLDSFTDQLAQLDRRLERLETHLSAEPSCSDLRSDPELAHKIAHACLTADHISEEEELRIMKAMMIGGEVSG